MEKKYSIEWTKPDVKPDKSLFIRIKRSGKVCKMSWVEICEYIGANGLKRALNTDFRDGRLWPQRGREKGRFLLGSKYGKDK